MRSCSWRQAATLAISNRLLIGSGRDNSLTVDHSTHERGGIAMCFRFAVVLLSLVVAAASANGADLSAESIGEIVGIKATTTPDGVIRVGWPRKDVPVTVDGTKLRPFAGLGSWAAFQ